MHFGDGLEEARGIDRDVLPLFDVAHKGVAMQGQPHFVSHMMDLPPVYNQPEDGTCLLHFPTQQIQRMKHFKKAAGGRMEYFVAYNPYREHWRGGREGDSLRIVKDAIKNHGATGVKIYPPSGYRAAGNQIKLRQHVLNKYPGQQWDARYGPWKDANTELNRRLNELLEWCCTNDVPVFTHCGTGEFEARKGYSIWHADPKYWNQWMEAYTKRTGRLCPLRLCLGHAGGDTYWFGGRKFVEWGDIVHQMCTTYPNVYCEVSAHADMINEDARAYYVSRLNNLFKASANLRTSRGETLAFSKKLLFGTDWYLPHQAPHQDIVKAAQTIFLHPSLKPHYRDYFHNNARRYLGSAR